MVALLDSAVARSPQPLTADAAAPLAWRAVYAERMGNARRATLDLVDYERLVPAAELRAPFFLRRAALAERARLYRRAVDDYTTAAARADTRELRLESLTLKALLCVHLSAGDEALAAAEELSRLAPDTPDALKLLGLAHQLLGHRTLAGRRQGRCQRRRTPAQSQVNFAPKPPPARPAPRGRAFFVPLRTASSSRSGRMPPHFSLPSPSLRPAPQTLQRPRPHFRRLAVQRFGHRPPPTTKPYLCIVKTNPPFACSGQGETKHSIIRFPPAESPPTS